MPRSWLWTVLWNFIPNFLIVGHEREPPPTAFDRESIFELTFAYLGGVAAAPRRATLDEPDLEIRFTKYLA